MTTMLEKKDIIVKNITKYLDENEVNCETTFFKNEYFTSVELEKEDIGSEGITYVLPNMPENPSNEDIGKALVDRFLVENKSLGFKPEQLVYMEEKFHSPLLLEAISAFSLNADMKKVDLRSRFQIMDFCDIFEKSGDTREMSNNSDLVYEGFKSLLYSRIKTDNTQTVPTMYAIAENFHTSESKKILKNTLGEAKQEKLYLIIPKLKDPSLKNKNRFEG